MNAEILRRAAAQIREDCPIPAAARGLDFIDFPTAWALQQEGSTAHIQLCSATQTGGAMLCDCEALTPTWQRWKALLAVAEWLDDVLRKVDMHTLSQTEHDNGIAVARAYLGDPS